jgi:hypothetical protein
VGLLFLFVRFSALILISLIIVIQFDKKNTIYEHSHSEFYVIRTVNALKNNTIYAC